MNIPHEPPDGEAIERPTPNRAQRRAMAKQQGQLGVRGDRHTFRQYRQVVRAGREQLNAE